MIKKVNGDGALHWVDNHDTIGFNWAPFQPSFM